MAFVLSVANGRHTNDVKVRCQNGGSIFARFYGTAESSKYASPMSTL